MSLPTAEKDISNKPGKNAVTDPVNPAEKDADVDRKIRLYGVITAFREGRMPSNAQIDETLQYVIGTSPVPVGELSGEGQRLIQDVRDLIETARLIVKQKNADELLQEFVWHTRDLNVADPLKAKAEEGKGVVPVDQAKLDKDGQQAIHHLRTLLSLVITNSEVRKLVSDFGIIGRDLLARGAVKAAGQIAPDEERLKTVDHTAEPDTFISKDGQKVGTNETPVLQASGPGESKIEFNPKIDEPSNAKVVGTDGTTTTAGDAATEASAQYDAAKEQATTTAQSHAEDVAGAPNDEAKKRTFFDKLRGAGDKAPASVKDAAADVDNAGTSEEKKQTIMSKIKGLGDRVPQEHKDTAQAHFDKTKDFLQEEFPEERRDQFIYRGKKAIIECQKHDDYDEAIRWLLTTTEEYASHARTAGDHATSAGTDIAGKSDVSKATAELKTLLERFANGSPMQPIFDAIAQLGDDAQKDEELKNWFSRVDAYIRKVLLTPGYVLEDDCNRSGRELIDSGNFFITDKYKGHFDNLFDQTASWFKAMGDDPMNVRFGKDWARITRDLLFDSEGKLTYKSHLWDDVRKVIAPTLIDKVGYIPIPRIEYTDDTIDLVIENLTLSGRNLLPNIISIKALNHITFSPYKNITANNYHEFTVHLEHIQADLRDVAFYFKNKKGIKISDSGLADIVLGGTGLSSTVTVASAPPKDRSSVFTVKKVVSNIDSLKVSIRDSKHDVLYKVIKPLIMGLVKKQIQKAINDAIKTGFEYIDGQLVSVRNQMDAAKDSDETTRTQVLKDLFAKGEKKADAASTGSSTSPSSFSVGVNKRTSLLPDAGHPAGWANKADAIEVHAVAGGDGIGGWKSKAFDIIPGKTPI